MARRKAVLILDPARRADQLAYVAERADILYQAGDQLWASITDEQVDRFAGRGIAVQVRDDADLVQVPAGVFDPVAALPEPPAQLREPAGDDRHHLVQFGAPPDPAWMAGITEAGANVMGYLLADVAVVTLPADLVAAVAALPYVRWVGPWQPAYAIGRSLVTQPDWLSVVPTATPFVDPARLPDGEQDNAEVTLFDDVASADVLAAVQATGVTVVADFGSGFVVRADPALVLGLARVPGVFAVEAVSPIVPANDRSGIILGTNQVRHVGAADFLVNLDGSGEIVGVIDSGLDNGVLPLAHPDLAGRVLLIANLVAPGSPAGDLLSHGTHTTGTIAGNGAASAGRLRGVAPAAHVVFHGLGFGPTGQATIVPATVVQGLEAAHAAGARVHSNSWASVDPPTGNAYAVSLDRFCFLHPDSLLVIATGNEEGDVLPAPGGDGILDANHLGTFCTGKNVLAVGATESLRSNDGFADSYRANPDYAGRYDNAAFDLPAGGPAKGYTMSDNADQVALFSNRGRVTLFDKNGRPIPGAGWIKPDLVAPGTNILSLRSSLVPPGPPPGQWQDSTTENRNLYVLNNGTSMATPQVAGAALLTRQYYRARFGQLRRPTLLEAVPVPAGPPRPEFVARPAVAPCADGLVFAWVRAGPTTDQRAIRAARLTRDLAVVPPAPVQLQADVGDHPAPALAPHGDHTLLVHRAKDATVRLSAYRPDLSPEPGFGNAGSITLSPASRPDDDRPPALAVAGDEAALAWADGGADRLLFQRVDAGTGAAVDTAAVPIGPMTQASPQPYLISDGTRYALAWVNRDGQVRRLHVRLVEGGTPVGAQPVVVLEQNADLRDPHLTWDPRSGRFVLVWCDERAHPGGDVHLRFLDVAGAPQGADAVCIPAPPTATVRRPLVAVHSDAGYVLAWEDDTQGSHFDVYLTFLDDTGQPDGRIPADPRDPLSRRLVRVSDTPDDTAGYVGLVDASGVALSWQSTDEINSDRRGAYAVGLTPRGAFRAQADPSTPLVESGRYVNHVLVEHRTQSMASVSMVSAGGSYFLLRGGPGDVANELQLVRTDADSLPEPGTGRALRLGVSFGQVEAHWTGKELICATVDLLDPVRVWLMDGDGCPTPAFGTGGQQTVDPGGWLQPAMSPGLGHFSTPAGALRIVVAFGIGFPAPDRLRYAVLDATGATVTAPRDLVAATGTARHGWFHVVEREVRSIAVWHRPAGAGAGATVFVNRFAWDGTPQHAADVQITTLPGESINGVLAVRPTFIHSLQREYGLLWQHRASGGQPWELRFSRLDRDGNVRVNPPPGNRGVPTPPVPTSDVRVISAGVGDWPADTDAVEPQLVSTFTHDPWADPPSPLPTGTALPEWSPGYGLAWLGQPAGGGSRTLYFTVLDENGVRALVPQPPPRPPAPAPITRVSRAGVDVREFALVWNGRTFRLTWTEVEGGTLRHVQTALTRHGSSAVYDEPSAALLRATLVNGATNILRTDLPNLDQPAPGLTSGYGWGRVNLRQSLAPSPPVTFVVRDDGAVGSGRSAAYCVSVPPGTALLRATLTWMDLPGAALINRLHLKITRQCGVPRQCQAEPSSGTAPAPDPVYQGNTWQPPPNDRLSRLVPHGTPFQSVHTTEQIVIENPPPGRYGVVVTAELFPGVVFNPAHVQPFALVVVSSGPEVRFGGLPGGRIPVY